MAQTNMNIRIDEDVKKQFDEICGQFGMSMSTAFNIFAKTVVRQQRIPFEISLEVPNAETMKAIEDVNSGRGLSGPYRHVEDLMEALDA